jgi:hypothetical protein
MSSAMSAFGCKADIPIAPCNARLRPCATKGIHHTDQATIYNLGLSWSI